MKRNKKIVASFLLIIFMIQIVFSENVLANPLDSKISTEICLLDNPGKTISWNTTSSLSTKLISLQNNLPIDNQNLSLYLREPTGYNSWKWILLCSSVTGKNGVVNFSFFVGMNNGKYNYSVRYSGQNSYISASNESYIVVKNDTSYNLQVTLSNVKCSVDGISFDYSMQTPSPDSYTYNWVKHTRHDATISKINLKVSVICTKRVDNNLNFFTYSYTTIEENSNDYGGKGGINKIDWNNGNVIYVAGQTEFRKIGQEFIPYYKWILPQSLPTFESFRYILVSVEAYGSYIDTAHHVFSSDDTTMYFNNTSSDQCQITDPDTTTPSSPTILNSGPAILQTQKPYILYIHSFDIYGWTANIHYKFINETVDQTFSGTNSTSAISPTTIEYNIPYNIWKNYVNCDIQVQTKIIDNFEPFNYIQGRLSTSWTAWVNVGRIYGNPGCDINSIMVYRQDGSSNWVPGDIGTGSSCFNSIYIGDTNYINLDVINPTNSNINISNPEFHFSSNTLTFTSKSKELTRYIVDKKGWSGDIGKSIITVPHGYFQISIPYTFNSSDFSDTSSTLQSENEITISFSYSINGTQRSNNYNYIIMLPPEPSIKFAGFEGPTEGGHLVLKDENTNSGSIIIAKFKVTNNAYIPVNADVNLININELKEMGCKIIGSSKNEVVVPGNSYQIVYFKLQINPHFFDNIFADPWKEVIKTVIEGLVIPPGIALFMAEINFADLIGFMDNWVQTLAPFSVIMDFLMSLLNFYTWRIATGTEKMEKDFTSLKISTSWEYEFHNDQYISNTYLNINNEINYSSELIAKPSNSQLGNFDFGNSMILMSSITFAVALGMGLSGIPLAEGAGALISVMAGSASISGINSYIKANDGINPDTNYTSVYTPVYQTINSSAIKPNSEFNTAVLLVENSSEMLAGDIIAVNETLNRQAGAITAGDNTSLAMQDAALANYTQMEANDYSNLQNSMGVLTTLIVKNETEIVNSTKMAEITATKSSFSSSDIFFLQNAGLNTTTIMDLNQSIANITRSNTISANMPMMISNMSYFYNASVPILNNKVNQLENMSNNALANSTNIKAKEYGIQTVDSKTLSNLIELNDSMYNFNATGKWEVTITVANQLISLARNTTLWTNNQSFMLTFGDNAQLMKQMAEQYLAITLQHLPGIAITPGIPQNFTLVISSEGAPTGIYQFETNSSWITQNDTYISVTKYNTIAETFQLSVPADYNIAPGTYPVNLRVSLPNTDTIVESVLMVTIEPFYAVQAIITPSVQTIFDNQTTAYQVNVKNLGNVPNTFNLNLLDMNNFTGIFMNGNSPLVNNSLYNISPGKTQSVSLQAVPFGLGTSIFKIQINSSKICTTVNGILTIIDDDTKGPTVLIQTTGFQLNPLGGINVLFTVSANDPKRGIDSGHVFIYAGGQVFRTLGSHVFTIYSLGNHSINATVSNHDDDWMGDEEWTTASESFNFTMVDYYSLIDREFNATQDYVTSNIFWHGRAMLIHRALDDAVIKFNNAWIKYQSGRIASAVVQDIVSQILTDITSCRVDILNDTERINSTQADVILTNLQTLENQLAMFAGFMVGTNASNLLALANNDANNLAIYIQNIFPQNWTDWKLSSDFKNFAFSFDFSILMNALNMHLNRVIYENIQEIQYLNNSIGSFTEKGFISVSQKNMLQVGLGNINSLLQDITQNLGCNEPSHFFWGLPCEWR